MQQEVEAIRAPWDEPGWQARVVRWVRAHVKGTAYGEVRGLEVAQKWALSCVLRVRTAGGDLSQTGTLYFKAVPPFFASEARITATLAHIFPDNVPMPLATDPRRNWMLLPDLGREDLREGTQPDEWCRVMRLLAWMQRECIGRTDELRRAGCGERGLVSMVEEIDVLCSDTKVLSLLEAGDRRKLLEAVPHLKALCARLAAYGVPETLMHGDFHGGNIARTGGRYVVFDWTDASISHPFLDLPIILNWHVPPDNIEHLKVRDTYLAEWIDFGSMERLREAMAMAFPLGSLFQVMSYRRMIRAMGEEAEGELKADLGMWVGRVLSGLV
jgi:hypothetical protein